MVILMLCTRIILLYSFGIYFFCIYHLGSFPIIFSYIRNKTEINMQLKCFVFLNHGSPHKLQNLIIYSTATATELNTVAYTLKLQDLQPKSKIYQQPHFY